MTTLEESVAQAMDGSGTGIVPFLPYILQDAWEIGTPVAAVVGLVRRHLERPERSRVLDLGCGKGAVAVRLAAELGCRCLGIDALAEFVAAAAAKAREFGVGDRCRFETGDVRVRIGELGRFDVIVLGAIGPVFGDPGSTLAAMAPHLDDRGLVVVDDGYLADESPGSHPLVARRGELLRQVAAAGMELAEEVRVGADEIRKMNETIFRDLETRCRELMARHPEKKELFAGYIRRQVEENAFLENDVICAVMAFKKQKC